METPKAIRRIGSPTERFPNQSVFSVMASGHRQNARCNYPNQFRSTSIHPNVAIVKLTELDRRMLNESFKPQLAETSSISARLPYRRLIGLAVLATVVMTGCRSAGGWNLFARRDAGSTLSEGPSTNYPMPPSAAATPQAIASIAGGTASPGDPGGASGPAIASSGSSAPPVSYAAAAANGFPSRAASFGKQNFGNGQLASSTSRKSDNPLDVAAGTTRVDMSAYAKPAAAPSTATAGLNATANQSTPPSAPKGMTSPTEKPLPPSFASLDASPSTTRGDASAFSLPSAESAGSSTSPSAFGSVPPSIDQATKFAAADPNGDGFGDSADGFAMPRNEATSAGNASSAPSGFQIPSMAGMTPPATTRKFGGDSSSSSDVSPVERTADASAGGRFSAGGTPPRSGSRSYAPGSTGAASNTYPGQKSDPQTSGSFYR